MNQKAGVDGRIAAIVNPAAGGGKAHERWRRVAAYLPHGTVEVLETVGPGDGIRLAGQAIHAGFRTLVAVGGDGTIHEVVNGMAQDGHINDDVRLGVVPAGTGMDFARNLRLAPGAEAASRRLLRGMERRIDVGAARAGMFVNFAEVGLGAAVVARQRSFKNLPGRAGFLLAALAAGLTEGNIEVEVEVDGTTVYSGASVSVVAANGRFFGSGMKIAPAASVDDGSLDVLVLGNFGRAELLRHIWRIYPGIHVSHPKVSVYRGRAVEIRSTSGGRLDLDGELYGAAQTSIMVLPRALRVLI